MTMDSSLTAYSNYINLNEINSFFFLLKITIFLIISGHSKKKKY